MLSLRHARSNDLGNTQSAETIDCDDIAHLGRWRLDKWNGNGVALADIVDQYRDIKIAREGFQRFEISILVPGEVHWKCLGFHGIFSLQFLADSIKLRCSA